MVGFIFLIFSDMKKNELYFSEGKRLGEFVGAVSVREGVNKFIIENFF